MVANGSEYIIHGIYAKRLPTSESFNKLGCFTQFSENTDQHFKTLGFIGLARRTCRSPNTWMEFSGPTKPSDFIQKTQLLDEEDYNSKGSPTQLCFGFTFPKLTSWQVLVVGFKAENHVQPANHIWSSTGNWTLGKKIPRIRLNEKVRNRNSENRSITYNDGNRKFFRSQPLVSDNLNAFLWMWRGESFSSRC